MNPAQAPTANHVWEYKVLFAADSSNLEEQLNKLSKEGYGLSQFQVIHPPGHKATFYCILIRDKQN